MNLHVKVLLHNIIVFQYGETGLMQASRLGVVDTVMILLEANANPNITNKVKFHYLYNSKLMHYVTGW